MEARHMDMLNVAFADGHAKRMKKSAFASTTVNGKEVWPQIWYPF
jgi:prepilin-type processing-associated H-X9-DG protein